MGSGTSSGVFFNVHGFWVVGPGLLVLQHSHMPKVSYRTTAAFLPSGVNMQTSEAHRHDHQDTAHAGPRAGDTSPSASCLSQDCPRRWTSWHFTRMSSSHLFSVFLLCLLLTNTSILYSSPVLPLELVWLTIRSC